MFSTASISSIRQLWAARLEAFASGLLVPHNKRSWDTENIFLMPTDSIFHPQDVIMGLISTDGPRGTSLPYEVHFSNVWNILQEFLVTVVCLKGCAVRFLKLQSSPCLRHPPCNYKEAGKRSRMRPTCESSARFSSIRTMCLVIYQEEHERCHKLTLWHSLLCSIAPTCFWTEAVHLCPISEGKTGSGQPRRDTTSIIKIVVIIISSHVPLLSHCPLWPSAYWNQLWESCPHWNGPTVGEKRRTSGIRQVNNSCHTDTPFISSASATLCIQQLKACIVFYVNTQCEKQNC